MLLKRTAFGLLAACVAVAATGQGYDYRRFAVPLYRGPRAQPVFTGQGARYAHLKTAISDAFAAEKLGAGHYVFIQIGCGSGCTTNIVGDVRTGELLSFPLSGEEYQGLSFDTVPTNRLISVKWGFNECTHRTYILNGTRFMQIGREEVDPKGCY